MVDPGRFQYCYQNGSMLRLSCYPHPRDQGGRCHAYSNFINKKSPRFSTKAILKRCRGRDRTFTRQLAIAQSSVVDPGHFSIATKTALCYVYPVILTPETRGHVCHAYAISSPHNLFRSITGLFDNTKLR